MHQIAYILQPAAVLYQVLTACDHRDPYCGCDLCCHSCCWHSNSSGSVFLRLRHPVEEDWHRVLSSSAAGCDWDSYYRNSGSCVCAVADCDRASSCVAYNSCPRL